LNPAHMSPVTTAPDQAARRDRPAWQLASLPTTLDPPAAEAFCRRVATAHYENFSVVSRLVPADLRQDFANIYAYARWSDDLADESGGDATAVLTDWRQGLDRCFAGRPDHPVFVALARTVARHRLAIEPFADLLDAFLQDQWCHRYADRGALLAYCRRSANPVGRLVLALADCRDTERVALSDAICTGLQLINFWQDIRRDRRAGRIYLPAADMQRHDVDETMLDADRADPRLAALVREEVAWARSFFDRGGPLTRTAPRVLRPAIGLFLAGGRGIAAAIERGRFDTLSRRPTLTRPARLALVARAAAGVVGGRIGDLLAGRRTG